MVFEIFFSFLFNTFEEEHIIMASKIYVDQIWKKIEQGCKKQVNMLIEHRFLQDMF